MFPEFGILGGYSYRAGVRVAFAHHHAAEHYQRSGPECEFFGSEQGHGNHVLPGFELSVGLQPHLSPESVQHQSLLGLAQSYFRRNPCIPHG